MKNKPATYIIIAGEGGHFEQAKRLCKLITDKDRNAIIVTEYSPIAQNCKFKTICEFNISRFSKKNRHIFLFTIPVYLFLKLILNYFIIQKYRPVNIITLGPFYSISWSLSAFIFRVKSIHIESWSKFNSASKTTKFVSKISSKVFYQNKSLSSVFSKHSEYIGRL